MTRKKFTDEFRKEAIQLALTSGLTRDHALARLRKQRFQGQLLKIWVLAVDAR